MKKMFSFFLFLSVLMFAQGSYSIDSLQNAAKTETGEKKVDALNLLSLEFANKNLFEDAIRNAEAALQVSESINFDVGKVQSYNNLANIYVAQSQLEKALNFSNKALKLAEKRGYMKGVADALRNTGITYNYLGKNDEAVNYLNRSLKVCREIDYTYCEAASLTSMANIYANSGKTTKSIETHLEAAQLFSKSGVKNRVAHSYLNIGSIYTNIVYDFEKGLEYTLKAKEMFLAEGDSFKTGYTMLVIGTIYDELEDVESSLQYYNAALAIFSEYNHEVLISITNNYIGEVYKKDGNYNKAIEFYSKSLDQNTKLKRAVGIAVALNNIGESYFGLKNTKTALEYYRRSLRILKQLDDIYKLAIAQNNIGEVYQRNGKLDLALKYYKEALDNALKAKALDEIKNSYYNLSELYQLKGNYKSALENYQKFSATEDSISNNEKSKEILKLQIGYETSKKNQEIELLKKSQLIAYDELKNSSVVIYATIGGAIILVLLLVALYNRFQYKKRTNKKLEKQNIKIVSQSNELTRINKELQEINRKIIASEKVLRDANDVKEKLLSIISHDLKSPFTSILGLTEFLSEDIDDLSEDEIRKFSSELHESTLNLFYLLENLLNWSVAQKDNLEPRIETVPMKEIIKRNLKLFNLNLQNKNIPVEDNIPDDFILNADFNMIDCIFRNLFHNAIKFSSKGQVIKLNAGEEKHRLFIEISDNGVGIKREEIVKILEGEKVDHTQGTENEKGSGLGLSLVRDFINRNNGKLEIFSNKGEGTTVKLSFPKN